MKITPANGEPPLANRTTSIDSLAITADEDDSALPPRAALSLPNMQVRVLDVPKENRKVVYLVRHGEAVHNIEEKQATKSTAMLLKAARIAPASPRYKQAMEEARSAVLRSHGLKDAALSAGGKHQAHRAKMVIDELTAAGKSDGESMFPVPTVVLTSPLQRTLQTTAIVFPKHPSIHIRECLRERRTGLPCDERQSALHIRRRPSFAHMSSNNLLQHDLENGDPLSPMPGIRVPHLVEKKEDVRQRSAHLPRLLQVGFKEADSVAVVTHKGFLRELERGPLGRLEATEFDNGEVRVYELSLGPDGEVISKLLRSGKDVDQETGRLYS